MDYRNKYLKYKTKYLAAKAEHNRRLRGGSGRQSGGADLIDVVEWDGIKGDHSGVKDKTPAVTKIQINGKVVTVENMHRASGAYFRDPTSFLENLCNNYDNVDILGGDSNVYYGLFDNDDKNGAILGTLDAIRAFVNKRYIGKLEGNKPYIFISKYLVHKRRPKNCFLNAQAATKTGDKILDTMMIMVNPSVYAGAEPTYDAEKFAEIMYTDIGFNFTNDGYDIGKYVLDSFVGALSRRDVVTAPTLPAAHTSGPRSVSLHGGARGVNDIIVALGDRLENPNKKKNDLELLLGSAFDRELKLVELTDAELNIKGRNTKLEGKMNNIETRGETKYGAFMESKKAAIINAFDSIIDHRLPSGKRLRESVNPEGFGLVHPSYETGNAQARVKKIWETVVDECYEDFFANTLRADKQSMNYFVNKFLSLFVSINIAGFSLVFDIPEGQHILPRAEWYKKLKTFLASYQCDHLFCCEHPQYEKDKGEFFHIQGLKSTDKPIHANIVGDHNIIYIDIAGTRVGFCNNTGLSVQTDRGIKNNMVSQEKTMIQEKTSYGNEEAKFGTAKCKDKVVRTTTCVVTLPPLWETVPTDADSEDLLNKIALVADELGKMLWVDGIKAGAFTCD
jgi:hypothetical protein